MQGDPQNLDETLGNLLDNAWQHARATVRVSARIVDRMVEIDIADDGGSGMAPEHIAELNTRRRGDERAGSQGLGIAIPRELAELHGGTLEFARADLGGLSATLRLPGGFA